MLDCPRCGQGKVAPASIRDLGFEIFVCSACDALWTHQASIGPQSWMPLEMFLASRGVQGGRAALVQPGLEQARAVVEANPSDRAARLDLARQLFESGDPRAALEHFSAVLQQQPADLDALQGAANAAVAMGDAARAEGYLRLLSALSGVTGIGPPPVLPHEGPEPQREDPVRLPQRGQDIEDPEDVEGSLETERPTVTLADVGGMDAVKRRLHTALLGPLKNPELRRLYGKSLRGGLLLFGPPGCGKTFIARATAGELGAHFLSVGLSDVLDMWLGNSEKRLHAIFEAARRRAPAVLFFDELDALGQKRTQLRNHGGRNVVNQLLAELDGAERDNEGIFVLGATNHPWDVDAALVRPGRFDRRLLVLPPDRPARESILRYHLRDRPTADLDIGWLASKTDGYSGADLAHLCDSAAEVALEASLTANIARPIGMADFRAVMRDVRPSASAWFETARNFAMFANEDGVYDDLLAYMREHKIL